MQLNVVIRFGVPNSLVFDIAYFYFMKVIHMYLTDCFLWIIQKTIVQHHRDWHDAFDIAHGEDKVTSRISLRIFSYFLVYGKGAILYLSSLLLVLSTCGQSSNFIQFRVNDLFKLADKRNKTKENFHIYTYGNKQFQISDLVLKWDKASKARGKHSKLKKLLFGPY